MHPIRLYVNRVTDQPEGVVLRWTGPTIDGLQLIPDEAFRRVAK